MSHVPDRWRSQLLRTGRFALVGLGAASLWAAGVAWREVARQGYVALGFDRTVYLTVRGEVLAGVLLGLLLGAVAGLAVVGLGALLRSPAGTGADDVEWLGDVPRRSSTWVGLAGAALAYLLVTGLRHGAVAGSRVVGVVLAGAGLAAVLAVAGWTARRATGEPRQRRALILAILCSGGLLVVGGYRLAGAPVGVGSATLVSPAVVLVVAALYVFLAIRGTERRPATAGSLLHPALWLAAVPVLVVLFAGAVTPGVTADRPVDVVLIGIDTLRHDHVTLADEGARRQLTPALEELARDGTVFRRAVSQAPWTMPAFASIMTGKYPAEHGAVTLLGRLAEGQLTLAEVLREAGYRTGAVVSHDYVARHHGFGQGFEAFDDSNLGGEAGVTSPAVTDAAIDFLERQSGPDPSFLFVHYFDPHDTYQDHDGFDFAAGYRGWLRDEGHHILNLRAKRHLLTGEDIGWLLDLYDEEIAFTDREIGRLVRYLRESGRLESTAVVVVADHGEEFMERGWIGHTVSLNHEVVQVPMVAVLPGVEAPREILAPVETRSIFPTLLDYLGVAPPAAVPDLDAGSLLPRLAGEAVGSPVFTSSWLDGASCADQGKCVRLSAIQDDRWKLIVDHHRGRVSLYDVAADPLELLDLADREPAVVERLAAVLGHWESRMEATGGPAGPAELTPEQLQRLRSLGYIR